MAGLPLDGTSPSAARGLFGGDLLERDGTAVERVPATIARALRDAPPREPYAPRPAPAANVELVPFEATDGEVRYDHALGQAKPLDALGTQRGLALEVLARVASAVGGLHAADTCHGDLGLGGDAIRVLDDEGRVALLVPSTRPAPGALLAARLRAGAPATIAAFSAPEVVTGFQATAASDVYALAAMAHELITGRAPLGQIDFSEARQGRFAALAPVIAAGLAANPAARPSVEALASALRDAAAVAYDLERPAAQAGPYRGGSQAARAATPKAKSAAEATAQKQAASSMSGILLLLLVVGGLFVFTGAVWLVGVTWSALDGAGRFFLLLALTSGVLGSGVALRRKGYEGSGHALTVLGVELLWANGAYLLDLWSNMDAPGAWAALAAFMTALAFVLGGALDSVVFAVLAALHYVIFAGAFGGWLHTGSPTGPATYTLAVALGAAGIALAGHRWRRERLGLPFAALGALTLVGSAIAGVALVGERDHVLFGTTWPYVAAAVAVPFALALEATYATFAALAAAFILATLPTAEAFVRSDEIAYTLAAVGVGFGVLGASFTWPRLARDPGAQAGWVVVGLANAVTAPSILFLVKCWDQDGLDALRGPNAIYPILVVLVSAALVMASYVLGSRARNKTIYRMLEIAGLMQLFATFTLQSLVRYKDGFYPLAILALGAACLVVGAMTKRAALVLLASAALLVNLSIQYFAKLWDLFPASLLVLVFGLLLLAGGVLYERRLKHLLPGLRAWG